MWTASRIAWTVGALALVAHAAHAVAGLGWSWMTGDWTTFGVFAACAIACLARALSCRVERAAWAALGTGIAVYALGQADAARMPGSFADGFALGPALLWLALYPAAIACMVLLVRAHRTRGRLDLWLDGVIGGLSVASLGVAVIFKLVIDPAGVTGAVPADLCFSLADLLVVGFGVGAFALLGWRPPASLVVLVAGFAVQGVQDALFLGQLLRGTYHGGGSLDGLWLVGLLAIASAAAWPRPAPAVARSAESRALVALPVCFGLVSVGVTVLEGMNGRPTLVPVILAALALTTIVARLASTSKACVAMSEAMANREAHLAHAQRLAGVGSWEWHAAGDRILWSAEQARLHGWTGTEPPRGLCAVLELLDADDREPVSRAMQAVWRDGRPRSLRYSVSVDGETRVVEGRGSVLRDAAGGPVGLVGTCQDITDGVRRVEAERASLAKSAFLSRLSHELRTPLNAILGFAQLLDRGELPARGHAHVGQILYAGRHLLELINEVLDSSRIEAGELALDLRPVCVGTILDEAVDLIGPLAAQRRIEVSRDAGAGACWAHADAQRLRQVLINLLSNAVKYNDEAGGVDVHVGATGDRVSIVVADTGWGIEPELLPRLFRPFERLGAEERRVEGTGLGLSLSKGLAEAMGGTIRVESVPGSGSSFTLELPAAVPDAPVAVLPAGAARRGAPAAA